MPQLRYPVATSLDGFIAGPNGGFDWITIDPDIDFAAMYARFGGCLGEGDRSRYLRRRAGPLMPTPGPRPPLRLKAHKVYTKTGTLTLEYDVV